MNQRSKQCCRICPIVMPHIVIPPLNALLKQPNCFHHQTKASICSVGTLMNIKMLENEDRVLQKCERFSEGKKGRMARLCFDQMLFMTGGLDRAFIVQRWRSGAMRIAACNRDQNLIETKRRGKGHF